MRKFLLLSSIFVASTVLAFGGGGGGGRTRRFYERHGGVDTIGVHIHENEEKPDIHFCNPCEDPVDDQCVPRTCGDNQHCDAQQDKCVCDNDNMYYGPAGSCTLCSDTGKIWNGTTCVCDTSAHLVDDGNGTCICNNAESYYGDPASCTLCSDTGKIWNGAACVCDPTSYDPVDNECLPKCETYQQRDSQNVCQDVICSLNANIYDANDNQVCVCPEHRDTTNNICGDCISETSWQTWTQPILTSNGTMGVSDFACNQSTYRGVRYAWRAFDGTNLDPEEDCWHNNDYDSPSWMSWYTSSPIKINTITIVNRPEGPETQEHTALKNFEIQYSDDNSNWNTQYSGVNPMGYGLSTTHNVNATTAHNYWRIYITTTYYNEHVTIGELIIDADTPQETASYVIDENGMCQEVVPCPTGYTGDGCTECADGYEEIDDVCVEVCPEGQERASNGECLAVCPDENVSRSVRDGTCSICKNGNVYLSYKDDPCGTATSFSGCKSNDECNPGQYCYLTNTSSSCNTPNNGECRSLGNTDTVNIEGLGVVRESYQTMTWWGAEQWCQAQGMKLLDATKIGCYFSGTTNPIASADSWGWCCAESTSCGDWRGSWNGTNITNESNVNAHSDIMIKLRQGLGTRNERMWASTSTGPANLCQAPIVNINQGVLGYDPRYEDNDNYGGYFTALCECASGYTYDELTETCVPGSAACPTGYTGDGCTECDEGYEMFNEACILSCESGQYHDNNGLCQTCPSTLSGRTSEYVCLACTPGGYWTGSACKNPCAEGKFHVLSGDCQSCDPSVYSTAAAATPAECALCGDQRRVFEVTEAESTSYYCAPKDCESGKYHANTGTCRSCSSYTAPSTVEECAVCAGYGTPRYVDSSDENKCKKCPADIASATSAEQCEQCFGGIYSGGICHTGAEPS